jgi:Coenzyme PQQ synthesis protein D (PqqD)
MINQITTDNIIVACKDQISTVVGEETIMLSLKSGKYYGLNSVGGRIWNLALQPTSIRHIIETLLGEYEVDRETCEQEVLALARGMAEVNLIEVWNGKSAEVPST